jgi:hypothetical protein
LVSVSFTDDARTFFRPGVKFYPKRVVDEKKKNILSIVGLKAWKTFGPSWH